MENFALTSNNLKKFEIMAGRRKISETHVRQIHGAILNNKNPIGIITVNKKNDKLRVIDGNHRIEAVKRYFTYRKTHADNKIECVLKVFENLTDDEERNVYVNEAKRKNETHEDRLNLYRSDITFWKLLQDFTQEFPCQVSIYNSKKALRLRNILNAFYTYKLSSEKEGFVPSNLKKDDIVEFAQELDFDDFLLLKDFISFFKNVYGKIESDNIFVSKHLFISIFDIYSRNKKTREKIGDKKTIKRFSNLIGRNELMNLSNLGGRENHIRVREIMIKYLNHRAEINLFI